MDFMLKSKKALRSSFEQITIVGFCEGYNGLISMKGLIISLVRLGCHSQPFKATV